MKKIYLGVAACFVLAVVLPFVFSEITSITLNTPANNTWTNDPTPDFNFTVISDVNTTFSCELFINDVGYGIDSSVANNTATTITANSSISDGSYSWYINCTDADGTNQSSIRTLNVDTTPPNIVLSSPSNNSETSNYKIDFSFKVIDNLDSSMSCELYIDDDKEDDLTADNNTVEKFKNINVDSGNHTWYVKCTDSAGNSNVSETRTFKVKSYCDEGSQGNVDIDKIKSPKSGDKFYPGDNITIEIKVKNNDDEDLDVVVKAELYDLDDDESIVDTETTVTIDKSESETVKVYLIVPANVNENHDFVIRVKAYEDGNEEEQCDDNTVSIIIKRENNSVIIEDLELDETTACGEIANLNFEVVNVGKEDENNIKIEISSAFFNWSSTFSLDSGDDTEISKLIEIPRNIAEGDYTITIKVYFDYSNGVYRKSISSSKTLKVEGNCLGPPAPDASISFTQTSDAFVGSSFTIKLAIKNTGNVKTNYTVNVNGYEDWATLESISPSTIAIDVGNTGYVYISLKPLENATGTNSFTAVVTFDSTSKEQTIDVEIKRPTEPASKLEQLLFELKRNWQWAALLLLLIVIIIILSILLTKQARHRHRFEPAEIRVIKPKQDNERKKKLKKAV